VGSTRLVEHQVPGVLRSLRVDDARALVGAGSRTNLELVLAGPTTLSASVGDLTVSRVALWVDEPREIAHQLRPRLGTPG
jgi:hypothetical protein